MAENGKTSKQDVKNNEDYLNLSKAIANALNEQANAQAKKAQAMQAEKNASQEALDMVKERANELNNTTNSLREQADITADINQSISTIAAAEELIASEKAKGGDASKKILKTLNEELSKQKQKLDGLDQELKKKKEIDDDLAKSKDLLDKIKNIPLIGQFLDVDDAVKNFNDSLKEGKDKGEAMADAMGNLGDQIDKAFAVGVILAMGSALLKANKSITSFNKELGVSREVAAAARKELAATAATADNLRVTTSRLVEQNMNLNSMFQTSAVFKAEELATMTRMVEANIMSEESASRQLASATRLGKTFEEQNKEIENIVNASNEATGANINLKTILEDTGKVTGQIRAQLGGNPAEISKAMIAAKALGFELEQIANAGKSLLDFETSINAELEAELLTGKQLNLERARLAALTGDYETLTEEINANVGDFSDFANMNVLQQEAIAKAVGMTADELSNSLLAEADRAALMKEAEASGDKQTIAMLEQMDAQEKFNEAINQLKELLVDVMANLEPIFNAFAGIADFLGSSVGKAMLFGAALGKMVSVVIKLRKASIGKSIADIFSSFAKIPFGIGIPLAFASVAGLIALIAKGSSKGDDVVAKGSGTSGYGDNTLMTKGPGGIKLTELNNRDTIIAGTDLFGTAGKANDMVKGEAGSMNMNRNNAPMNVTIQNKSDSFNLTNPVSIDGIPSRTTKHRQLFS